MIRTIRSFGVFRYWLRIVFAGVLGVAAAFAAAKAIEFYSTPVTIATIILMAAVGALLCVFLAGSWSARQIIRKLNAQNMRRDLALNNMVQGLCMFDGQGRLVVWNSQYQTMYKLQSSDIWRGCTIRQLLEARKAAETLPHDPAQYEAELKAALDRGNIFKLEVEMEDGRVIAVINHPTKEGGWLATHEDITEHKRAERELENTRAFLDMIVENVPSPIIVKSADDLTYLLLNHAAETYFGIDRAAIIGKRTADILPKAIGATILAEDRRAVESGQICYQGEHGVMTPGNGMRIATATRFPVKAADGKSKYLITVIHDITDLKRHEQRIAHMAHHDSLTDLPNRSAFNECIDATVEMAARAGESFGVLCIDLERFKAINDVFGHPIGDAALA